MTETPRPGLRRASAWLGALAVLATIALVTRSARSAPALELPKRPVDVTARPAANSATVTAGVQDSVLAPLSARDSGARSLAGPSRGVVRVRLVDGGGGALSTGALVLRSKTFFQRRSLEGGEARFLVPRGRYRISVEEASLPPGVVLSELVASSNGGLLLRDGTVVGSGAYRVDVSPGADIELEGVVHAEARLNGRLEGVEGISYEDLVIELAHVGRRRPLSTRVKRDGTFRFDALEPGVYRLHAGMPFGARAEAEVRFEPIEIRLEEGEMRDVVVARVTELVRVEGRLLLAGGAPAAGHAAVLVPSHLDPDRAFLARALARSGARSGKDGRFELAAAAGSNADLWVSADPVADPALTVQGPDNRPPDASPEPLLTLGRIRARELARVVTNVLLPNGRGGAGRAAVSLGDVVAPTWKGYVLRGRVVGALPEGWRDEVLAVAVDGGSEVSLRCDAGGAFTWTSARVPAALEVVAGSEGAKARLELTPRAGGRDGLEVMWPANGAARIRVVARD